jgi:ParB-like chromosome segregation protein Spo0J
VFQIESVSTDSLTPYEKNSRQHTPEQIRQIAKSIETFGFTNPLIVHNGTVVAGHGRLEAAKLLGIDEVPVIDRSDMSEAQWKAYVVADNKLGDNSVFDSDLLAIELGELQGLEFDLSSLGFMESEIDDIFDVPLTDPNAEWDGMPEFSQPDETSLRHINVHFKTQEDLERFGKLIKQNLTTRTRAIWFPAAEIGRTQDKRYVVDKNES